MTRRLGLGTRLSVYLLTVLLVLELLALAFYLAQLDERRRDRVDTAQRVAQNIAVAIDSHLRDIERTSVAVAEALAAQAGIEQTATGPYLARVIAEYPSLRAIFVTDPGGRVIATNGTGLGVDLSTRPYLVALRAGAEKVWSGSLTGIESGEITVAFGRRIGASSAPRGHLVFAFYPERLLTGLGLAGDADSDVVLTDGNGLVLYHSRLPSMSAAERDLSRVPQVRQALAGGTVPLSADPLFGEPRYGAFVSVPTVSWAVGYLRPQAPLEDALRNALVGQIALASLALLIAGLLLIGIARRLTRPIAQLAREAAGIARGERPAILVPASAGVEVQQLGEAMRAMSQAVATREDDLHYALRTRDEFLASVAHELKTPLTSIKGFSQLLDRAFSAGRADPAAIRETLARIDLAAKRMNSSVEELLELARSELGGSPDLARSLVDLLELVRAVARDVESTTSRHEIRIDAPDVAIVGEWDRARIERVVQNLLSNAVKYSPDGGEVLVRVRTVGDRAVVTVSDRGIGIPPAELERIFARFYRGSNVTTHISGTGIGLTLVRQIVEQHGGNVSVESEPGRGSTFRVALPLRAV